MRGGFQNERGHGDVMKVILKHVVCELKKKKNLSKRSKWRRRFLGGDAIPVLEAIRAWFNRHPWLVSGFWVSCLDYASAIRDGCFISI